MTTRASSTTADGMSRILHGGRGGGRIDLDGRGSGDGLAASKEAGLDCLMSPRPTDSAVAGDGGEATVRGVVSAADAVTAPMVDADGASIARPAINARARRGLATRGRCSDLDPRVISGPLLLVPHIMRSDPFFAEGVGDDLFEAAR